MKQKAVFPILALAVALSLLLASLCLLLMARTAIEPAEAKKIYYRVAFYQGDDLLTWEQLEEGSTIQSAPQKTQAGRTITRWLDETGTLVELDSITVTGDMNFYTYEAPALNTETHVSYMGDIDSIWFQPNATLSREEAAQILYALLEKPEAEVTPPEDTDVSDDTGEEDADVSDDTGEDEGDTENTEDPQAADRQSDQQPALPLTDHQPVFSDVDESSAYYTAIRTVTSYCLMSGYPDGTFRPQDTITRAEFVSMLTPYGEPAPSDGTDFADVPADYWAADAIAAAVQNGWLVGFDDGYFYPDQPLTRAEAVVIINRMMGYDVDSRAINALVPQNLFVDITANHWAYYDILDATCSSELLSYVHGDISAEAGFIRIDDTLYHINDDGQLDYYEAGFHEIDGQLRYCSTDGYSIDEFSQGIVYDLNGSMYYVDSDGSFCRDSYHGYLYFGSDGKYTSGSEYLDTMVEAFLDGILDDESMSQYDKLYAAYQRVKNRFGYLNWGDGYEAGSTDWVQACAEVMFEEERGHCYYWAAAYMYLARRLGYQAYCVAGIAGTLGSWHAWVMIDWSDGSEYILDPELEWSYEQGYLDGYVQHRDMFMQPFYATKTLYTFADGSHTTERR